LTVSLCPSHRSNC